MTIPSWLDDYLKQPDLEDIEAALKAAESKTTGEIVPMIVRRSSSVGHVAPLLLLIAFSLVELLEILNLLTERWVLPIWVFVAVPLVVFFLVRQLMVLPFIERLCTLHSDRRHQVEARAILEFYRNGLDKTQHRNGVLIFVSLMERSAVILGDQGIDKKIPGSEWQAIVQALVSHASKKELEKALCVTIGQVGQVLTQHFPSEGPVLNELKNQLLVCE